MKKTILLIAFALLLTNKSNAQGNFLYKHEIGAGLGLSNFQGDFNSSGPADGKITVNGFTIEGSHYLHVIPRSYGASKFYRHAMLKTSLAYTYTGTNNDGLGKNNTSLNGFSTTNDVLLSRLESNSSVLSLDNELQLYFSDILKYLYKRKIHSRRRSTRGFSNGGSKFNGYIGLGFGINYYNANPTYSAENIKYPDNYEANDIKEKNSLALSGNLSIGTRYKLGYRYNLFLELKTKLYSSDWIDGLNPEIEDDIFNDYNTTINIGVIYNLL